MGDQNLSQTASSAGYVDFVNLDFGTWTITSTYAGKTRTNNIELNILNKLYQIDHRINVASIRINGYEGTSVTVSMGGQSYNQTISSAGYVDFYNLDYGTWTITSAKYGVNKVDNINLNILGNLYQLSHYIEEPIKIYGIAINQDNTDPTSAVTYTGAATGFTPLYCDGNTGICNYGSWKDIITNVFGCRPCLVKDGVRTTYLNPDNYTQDINGNPVDITSGDSGDVMVEFKKCWYRYRNEGNTLYFELAEKYKEGFITTAFKSEDGQGRDVDYFYYGAYESLIYDNGKLRSLSEKTPGSYIILYKDFISGARQNSNGSIDSFCKRMYINGLLLLVTKSRNISEKIGYGNLYKQDELTTGSMNDKGLFYGRNINTEGVKCFGIENLWGNLQSFMGGFISKRDGLIGIKLYAPYAESDDYDEVNNHSIQLSYSIINFGYTDNGIPIIQKAYENGAIILPSLIQSDRKKCWTDEFYINTSYPGFIGLIGSAYNSGSYNNNITQGPFTIAMWTPQSTESWIGSRYVYAK